MRKNSTLGRIRIFFSILILPILASCSKQRGNDFDLATFENDQGKVTLAFDLREDDTPIAGLVINATSMTIPTLQTVALPFASESVSSNEEIFSTSGSYDETTLISYYLMNTTNKTYGISIIPIFQPPPENYSRPDDIKYSVAIIKDGLDRFFVFRYPDSDPYRQKWIEETSVIANTEIDFIGIALPRGAKGQQIRDTDSIAIPNYSFQTNNAKFYPANSKMAKTDSLEIKYRLPPTQGQNYVLQYGVTLFLALLSPFIQILVKTLNAPQEQNTKTYKALMISLIGVQSLIIIVLIIFAIREWDESSVDAISKLVIAVIGGFVTGYVLWLSNKSAPN